jgi:hypothetical protein
MPAIFSLNAIGITTAKSPGSANRFRLRTIVAHLTLMMERTPTLCVIAGQQTRRVLIRAHIIGPFGGFSVWTDAHAITAPAEIPAPFRAAGNAIITTVQTSFFQATCDVSHITADRNAAEGKDKNER